MPSSGRRNVPTELTRLIRVEEKVELLDVRMERIEEKLDDLLSLKHKGTGALWLIGIVFGTSAMTVGVEIMKWLLGK